ncbi:MAG: 30S ribosomal protein S6 [Planctomyces sp.]|nr:30S ribosomal protein S6 [Planctomyces sp.]
MAQRLYECMFLLDSGRFATDPQGTETQLRDLLGKCQAEIVSMGPWQDGKLAYPIDGHKKGLHFLVYFKMDGGQVQELNRLCRLSDQVIRHMLIQQPGKLFDMMSHALAQHGTAGEQAAAPAEPAAAVVAEPVAAAAT